MAVSDDGAHLAIASASAGSLTLLDASTLAVRRSVAIGRSPEAVDVENGRAFVTHLGRSEVSIVDLAGDTPPRTASLSLEPITQSAPKGARDATRAYGQAYALASVTIDAPGGVEHTSSIGGTVPPTPKTVRRIVVPGVSVDPGERDPGRASRVYYGPPPVAGITKEMPVAVPIDVASERPVLREVLAASDQTFVEECMLPRAAAFRVSTSKLYVACRGIDELLELDGTALDPMRAPSQRIPISKGVAGLAIDDHAGIAVAFSEFVGALDVVNLASGTRTSISLDDGAPPLAASYRQGRDLFYRTNDTRITLDGVGCASCHPDGLDDGLTWSTPEGRRQTPVLAGRLHGTAPYGWTRGKDDLPTYIADTIERLGGTGLSSSELVALASYIERMDAPVPARLPSDDVARGRAVFLSSGCEHCHSDEAGTDHEAHDLTADGAMDTPSLRS